jgi:hypothetical protein
MGICASPKNPAIRLVSENIRQFLLASGRPGYRPLAPITAEEFAEARLRESPVRGKGMQVLGFSSERHPETPVDAFATEPFAFEEEYSEALVKPLHRSIIVRFVSIPALIRMKEAADRPRDRNDVEHLRMRLEDDGQK